MTRAMLGLQVSAVGWVGAGRSQAISLAGSAVFMAMSTFITDDAGGHVLPALWVGWAAAGIAWLPNHAVGTPVPWPCLPVTHAERRGSASTIATTSALALTVGVQGVGMLVNGRFNPSILFWTTFLALMAAWGLLGMNDLASNQGRAGRRKVTPLGMIGFGYLLGIYGIVLPAAALLDRAQPGGSMLLLLAAASPLVPAAVAGTFVGTRWRPRGPLSWMPVRLEQARLWAAVGAGALGIPFLATHLFLRAAAEVAPGASDQRAPITSYLAAAGLWILLTALPLAPPSWSRARVTAAVVIAAMLSFGFILSPIVDLMARYGQVDATTASAAPFLAGALLLTSVALVAKR